MGILTVGDDGALVCDGVGARVSWVAVAACCWEGDFGVGVGLVVGCFGLDLRTVSMLLFKPKVRQLLLPVPPKRSWC